MASSTSALLELELMAGSENDGTWGVKANTVMQLIENAIAGATSVSVTGGFRLLTDTDLVANEARKAVLRVSGTLASNQTVVIPNRSKTYRVRNETTGAYTLTISTPTTFVISGSSGEFQVGETVTGSTSGETAVVLEYTSGTILTVHTVSGAFTGTETITGSASGETATYASTSSPVTTVAVTQGSVASIYCDGSGNIFHIAPLVLPSTGAPSSSSSGTSASLVSFAPFGNTTSTNVQDAIVELQTEYDTLGLSGKQDSSTRLTEIASVATSQGQMLVSNGSGWTGLAFGTTGQQLQADSAQANGVKWITPEVDGASKTKGTIYASNGSQFVALGVGSDGQRLVADSTASTGVKWAVPGVADDSITNAMLADVASKTVKGRTASGTGAPTDLTMPTLATDIVANATALATLAAVIEDFDPANDVRGTIETGTITVPSSWTTYCLFGYTTALVDTDPSRYGASAVWRSSVTRSIEPTQTPSDYYPSGGNISPIVGNSGVLVAIRIS